MRKLNNGRPRPSPEPKWPKPDTGFYRPRPEKRPTIEVYQDLFNDMSNRARKDKNGNLIVRLDNGSYILIDQQGNSSPYKPPKLPIFPKNIFKPQYPAKIPDSWNTWPKNPRPGPLPIYPERPRRPQPNPWSRSPPYNPINPWGNSEGGPLPLIRQPKPEYRKLPKSPSREPEFIRFGKSMSKRAIPTQRTDNTRNKYGI
jgi:hypothetical protein